MNGTVSTANRRALLLCFHNHQPVGNFESVLGEATRDSYLPFLQMLAEFPSIRATIHYSGWLLQWIEKNSPQTFSLLKKLISGGQVEILGGGMYEPALALLPERDRQGQLRALAGYIERRFGKAPEGIWLAERVWEPEMPATLSAGGRKASFPWTTTILSGRGWISRSSTVFILRSTTARLSAFFREASGCGT